MKREIKEVDTIHIFNGGKLSAYIVSINNEEKIIMALNISDACDKLDEMGVEHYKFRKSKSINIIY